MHDTPSATGIDPITLEVLWNRLIAVVNEQATALMRTSFTTVVRESGDLSAGVFDPRGYMIAQAVTGTPGHINSMATCIHHFLAVYPAATLRPGDVLITNDPQKTSGQLHDFTVISPIFDDAGATDRLLRLDLPRHRHRRARPQRRRALDVRGRALRADHEVVRRGPPERGTGEDHPRQCARAGSGARRHPRAGGGQQCRRRAAEGIHGRVRPRRASSRSRTRSSIAPSEQCATRSPPCRTACTRHSGQSDGFDAPVTLAVTITKKGDTIHADWTGSSPASPRGINVVLNYTHAYVTYALKCALCPEVPNNEGSFRPVTVTAPPGSLLNALPPAPVAGRHVIGHFLPGIVFGALAPVLPGRVIAEGAANIWATQLTGRASRRRIVDLCLVLLRRHRRAPDQ